MEEVFGVSHMPQLSGYEPPAATKSPRLSPLVQNPQGELLIPFTLRSSYDSTHVNLNGMSIATIGTNTAEHRFYNSLSSNSYKNRFSSSSSL